MGFSRACLQIKASFRRCAETFGMIVYDWDAIGCIPRSHGGNCTCVENFANFSVGYSVFLQKILNYDGFENVGTLFY